MTRTFVAPDGTSWTAELAPPSRHRKTPDPKVTISFVSEHGKRRLQRVEAPFDLEAATEAELLAVFERDEWGLLGGGRP